MLSDLILPELPPALLGGRHAHLQRIGQPDDGHEGQGRRPHRVRLVAHLHRPQAGASACRLSLWAVGTHNLT